MDRVTRFVLGPLLILGGFWFIAMPFAFAAMSFGGRETPPGWAEYLGEVFGGGVSSLSVGALLAIGGLFLAATGGGPPGQGAGTKAS